MFARMAVHRAVSRGATITARSALFLRRTTCAPDAGFPTVGPVERRFSLTFSLSLSLSLWSPIKIVGPYPTAFIAENFFFLAARTCPATRATHSFRDRQKDVRSATNRFESMLGTSWKISIAPFFFCLLSAGRLLTRRLSREICTFCASAERDV